MGFYIIIRVLRKQRCWQNVTCLLLALSSDMDHIYSHIHMQIDCQYMVYLYNYVFIKSTYVSVYVYVYHAICFFFFQNGFLLLLALRFVHNSQWKRPKLRWRWWKALPPGSLFPGVCPTRYRSSWGCGPWNRAMASPCRCWWAYPGQPHVRHLQPGTSLEWDHYNSLLHCYIHCLVGFSSFEPHESLKKNLQYVSQTLNHFRKQHNDKPQSAIIKSDDSGYINIDRNFPIN